MPVLSLVAESLSGGECHRVGAPSFPGEPIGKYPAKMKPEERPQVGSLSCLEHAHPIALVSTNIKTVVLKPSVKSLVETLFLENLRKTGLKGAIVTVPDIRPNNDLIILIFSGRI
jgi:hypothetical protein